MSEESTTADVVELSRHLTQSTSERDMHAVMAFYKPDPVWDMSPMGLGTYEGVAAISGFVEDWFASYEDYTFDAEEVLDLGNGVAFAVCTQGAALSAAPARFSCGMQRSACGRTGRSHA